MGRDRTFRDETTGRFETVLETLEGGRRRRQTDTTTFLACKYGTGQHQPLYHLLLRTSFDNRILIAKTETMLEVVLLSSLDVDTMGVITSFLGHGLTDDQIQQNLADIEFAASLNTHDYTKKLARTFQIRANSPYGRDDTMGASPWELAPMKNDFIALQYHLQLDDVVVAPNNHSVLDDEWVEVML